MLDGVVCIQLDATVTIAHSDKELAEAGYKGYGLLTKLPEKFSQFSERLAGVLVTVPSSRAQHQESPPRPMPESAAADVLKRLHPSFWGWRGDRRAEPPCQA